MSKTKISWKTPEYEYYPKNKKWIAILGIAAAILFLIGLLLKNYLFCILIGLSFFAIAIYAFRKPEIIKITIDYKGIKIDNILYKYENLRSFWIFYDPPIKELSLRSKKTIMPYIKIPFNDQSPTKIRKILIQHLPEKKHRESIIENLARQIKF